MITLAELAARIDARATELAVWIAAVEARFSDDPADAEILTRDARRELAAAHANLAVLARLA